MLRLNSPDSDAYREYSWWFISAFYLSDLSSCGPSCLVGGNPTQFPRVLYLRPFLVFDSFCLWKRVFVCMRFFQARFYSSSLMYFWIFSGLAAFTDKGKFLLAAKRFRCGAHTEYIISLDADDLSQGSNAYMGKLRCGFGTSISVQFN